MKKYTLVFALTFLVSAAGFAQTEITRKNSWLKAGAGIGIPVGELSKRSNASLNIDVKGQVLSTPNTGFGVTTGYTHYFPTEGHENFGSIPVGVFGRYYVSREGLFVGSDLGYSFQTGSYENGKGGIFVKPQIGYHNRLWNVFGFYNGVFRGESQGSHLQQVGVGFAYNFMSK